MWRNKEIEKEESTIDYLLLWKVTEINVKIPEIVFTEMEQEFDCAND